jgi:hypothetical protein
MFTEHAAFDSLEMLQPLNPGTHETRACMHVCTYVYETDNAPHTGIEGIGGFHFPSLDL